MSPAGFSKRFVGGIAMAALTLAIGTALVAVNWSRPQARLQQIANDAALAGVNALVESVGQPGAERIRTSVAAAQAALADRSGALRSLSGSAEELTLSVVLVDPRAGAQAAARAIYQPPSDGVAAQDSAALRTSFGPNVRAPL
uniref:Uncharacterized protein n=1 Tax=Rhodopseudomonas palustris (strain BisA53) TaxID=316055 RepID=Q07M96_RHOP5